MLGFGGEAVAAVDAPSGHRLDLLAPGAPLRERLGLPDGRFERHRVCDALLFRRRLPLYPVPAANQPLAAWERWIGLGFELFAALEPLARLPARGRRRAAGRIGAGALRFGRLCETYPDAVFCSMIGHRPSPKRTPWGLQERIAALRARGVVDTDGGLWHRTLDELDACAAAYAAYTLANGGGSWVGDPREGVIVLPVEELLPRYDPLPLRTSRAGQAATDVAPKRRRRSPRFRHNVSATSGAWGRVRCWHRPLTGCHARWHGVRPVPNAARRDDRRALEPRERAGQPARRNPPRWRSLRCCSPS